MHHILHALPRPSPSPPPLTAWRRQALIDKNAELSLRNAKNATPLERLASILRWYLTSISLWHRAIISSSSLYKYSPLSRTLARPSERSGGRGARTSRRSPAPSTSRRCLSRLVPSPHQRGEGGEGVALRYYCCDFS